MLRSRHNSASRFACALALCLTLLPSQAIARPLDERPPAADEQRVHVTVTQPTPSVATDGTMRVAVEVSLSAPAEYVEVRLRVRQPGGRLVYQKTEVRANLQPGQNVIEYEHDLAELDLAQGRYPVDVRVLATGSAATTVSTRLLLVDPRTEPLPVALVVLASDAPAVTSEGLLATDPAKDTRLRDDLSFVTRLAADRHAPLAVALPPVLLEQLGRIAAGYETTAGVVVPPTAEVPTRAGRLLGDLRSAIETGTVDVVDVPYALPDLARLLSMSAAEDLARHWRRTDEVNAALLGTQGGATAAYLGHTLTEDAVASAVERGAECVLARAPAFASNDETAAPGCYQLEGQDAHVVVIDEAAAEGAHGDREQFYDALFARLGAGPAVIMLPIGTGDVADPLAVQHALEWVQEAGWLRLAALDSLEPDEDAEEVTLATPRQPASDAYWRAVASGRSAGLAYVAAAGEDDPEALAVLRAVLISESSLFPKESADEAYDGVDFASAAQTFVQAQFALIRLDTKDVTLSGTKGDVPLTLINDTGKPMQLTVRARSAAVLPDAPDQAILAGPTQNFLTVPIDLGNALSQTLHVEVLAGDVPITETNVVVRASYIDRLAIILMVILVLGGLLLFIRKRVLSSDAATIEADDRRRRAGRRE